MQWVETGILGIFTLYVAFVTISILILLFRKKESETETYIPTSATTIIIPVRNEEQNILKCLEGIAAQNFPKSLLQVIVIDDHSSDNTFSAAGAFLENNFENRLLLRSGSEGKKSAILRALEHATGKIIITRDADTFTTSDLWLKNIVAHFEKNNCDLLISPAILIASPLFSREGSQATIHRGDRRVNSFLSSFQQFENLAITTIGAAMAKINLPFVCSGANLAYRKEAFLKTGPYKDNLSIASGDDMFVLKHFYKASLRIHSNTNPAAPVFTPVESSFSKMLAQRLRWAAKTGKINTFPVIFTGLLVLIVNLLTLPVLCLGFVSGSYWWFSLFTLTLKFIIDFLLLFLSTRMYQQKVSWFWLPFAFLFNSMYVPLVVGASVFVKPTWKSRRF